MTFLTSRWIALAALAAGPWLAACAPHEPAPEEQNLSAENKPMTSPSIKPPRAPVTPRIDGSFQRLEWMQAGAWFAEAADAPLGALYYGRNEEDFVLALMFSGAAKPVRLTLRAGEHEATLDARPDQASAAISPSGGAARTASGGEIMELALPWKALGMPADAAPTLEVALGGQVVFSGKLP